MKHFLKIADGIDISAIAMALHLQPELWNQQHQRKSFEGSAHKATSDIWLRYNDLKNLGDDYHAFTQQHESVWYPAASALPVKPLIHHLASRMLATRIGGCLITKIAPGGKVLPHIDKGWHPEYYNCKLYVPIKANPKCANRVEDEWVVMSAGDCWYFDNTKEHEVTNDGDDDRMTLIISLKVES